MDEAQKLFEALTTIKEICNKYDAKDGHNCERCPLQAQGSCAITDYAPSSWPTLNDPSKRIWQAFIL